MRSVPGRAPTLLPALMALLLLSVAGAAPAGADSAQEAENLVRQLYYEGIPAEQTHGFDERAVARLGAMLQEPGESEYHANIVMALGTSGHPHAFPLLAAYARRPLEGEVDRATFRARTRVPQAMGHLARSDRRALHWLLARAEAPETEPDWRFRHHAGEPLALLLEEQVLFGLALSGADEADAALQRAAEDVSGSGPAEQRRRRHLEQARRTHRRVHEPGPDGGPVPRLPERDR